MRAMSFSLRNLASYSDLAALPDNVVGEIVGGELVVSPRPAAPHALAASTLGMDIGGSYQRGRGGPGGWWILSEPELHLSDDVLVPDIVGWRKERLPSIPNTASINLAPDWICEVISPSTAGIDRVRKLPIYAREGVDHVWLVDPKQRTLEVYGRRKMQWLVIGTYEGAARVRAAPFAELELELDALWTS